MTRSWVEEVKNTIPEYAEIVADRLVVAMSNSLLDEKIAHGCALAAAAATANGGLAFEISMNGPLFGSDEREIAKKAAVLVTLESALNTGSCDPGRTHKIEGNYAMYAYAAAVAMQNISSADYYSHFILTVRHEAGKQIRAIAEIAASVAAIGKIT